MLKIDCDLHIHSRFSGGVSKEMNVENIARYSKVKGLDLVATGDILHKTWLKEVKVKLREFSYGIYEYDSCKFVLSTEVEDKNRVHHLILLPDFESVEELRSYFSRYGNLNDGRPRLNLSGAEILDAVRDVNGLIGPSHAFVPWTSIYKEFNSLKECYGSLDVDFLELGLSADSDLADRIKELENITFLSNSDAHSPQPHRLGREFNRILLEELDFENIRKAFERRGGNRVILNVGLDPRLGKYHRTACTRCYHKYSIDAAERLKFRCKLCGGRIKKGVIDRINELATYEKPKKPKHRPRYLRIVPLAEIISIVINVKSVYSYRVKSLWHSLVEHFGSEIKVLVDADIDDIAKVSDGRIAEGVKYFRHGLFKVIEGGGGRYGKVVFGDEHVEERKQKTLIDFWRK